MGEAEFLSVRECAEQIGVSRMTVYRLVHDGIIRSIRVGRAFRVERAAWEEYLQRAEVDPDA